MKENNSYLSAQSPEKLNRFNSKESAINSTKLLGEQGGAKLESKENSIGRAIFQGDLTRVKLLLKEGVKLNAQDASGNTLLHKAIFSNNLEIIKYLVDQGADLKLTNNAGITPLQYVALNAEVAVVKYFIEEKNIIGRGNLLEAVKNAYLGIVRYLVEERGADVDGRDNYGSSLLHIAVRYGYLQIAKYLIEQGADLEALDTEGNTPLHVAVHNRDLKMATCLIELGANLEAKSSEGNTLLHMAVLSNDLALVKYLVAQGIQLETKDNVGDTALYIANWENRVDLVKYLVEQGADFTHKDQMGNTLLDIARSHKDLALVEFFEAKEVSRERRSTESQLEIIFPDSEDDVATSGASQSYSWIGHIAEGLKNIPQLLFSSPNVALAKREGVNGVHQDMNPGNVNVDNNLLLCDLIVRKMTGKRHSVFFKEGVSAHLEAGDRIIDAIDKFPSTVENMIAAKGFNSTFKY